MGRNVRHVMHHLPLPRCIDFMMVEELYYIETAQFISGEVGRYAFVVLYIMQVSRRLYHCTSTKQNFLTSLPRPGSVCRGSPIFQLVFQIRGNITRPLWSS